jgi:hypothetical protein
MRFNNFVDAEGLGVDILEEMTRNAQGWHEDGHRFDELKSTAEKLYKPGLFVVDLATGADLSSDVRGVPASSLAEIDNLVDNLGSGQTDLSKAFMAKVLFDRLKVFRNGQPHDELLDRYARFRVIGSGVTLRTSLQADGDPIKTLDVGREIRGIVSGISSAGIYGGAIALLGSGSTRKYRGLVDDGGKPRISLELSAHGTHS